MSDLEQLRRLADEVAAPPYAALVAAARRRDRRRAVVSVLAGVTSAAVVAVGVGIVQGDDSAAPDPTPPVSSPSTTRPPSPTKTEPHSLDSMTAQEVVAAEHAELTSVAVNPLDPDIRMSVWRAQCRWCPEPSPDRYGGQSGRPTFTGMAITTDGYATAVYARSPFTLVGPEVTSPREDVFLVNDTANGREWLIGTDGSVRKVERVATELRPADPRLWFSCSLPGGVGSTWCSLDIDAGTAHLWPTETWGGSVVGPQSGERPWGATMTNLGTYEDPGSKLHVWWEDENGVRQSRTLADDVLGGTIAGLPRGELAGHTWRLGADTVDLHVSSDRGAGWQVQTRAAPDFNRWVQIVRAPDGGWVAWTYWPDLAVWRADADGGAFARVLEAAGPEVSGTGVIRVDDVLYVSAAGTAAISTDDGRTWTTYRTWRPEG